MQLLLPGSGRSCQIMSTLAKVSSLLAGGCPVVGSVHVPALARHPGKVRKGYRDSLRTDFGKAGTQFLPDRPHGRLSVCVSVLVCLFVKSPASYGG